MMVVVDWVWHSIVPLPSRGQPPGKLPGPALQPVALFLSSSQSHRGTGLHKKVTSQSFLMIRLLCAVVQPLAVV